MSQDPEWVKEPPARGHGIIGIWEEILAPLVKSPGRWAKIYEADEPELAQSTASNLSRRLVRIPKPDAAWEFISRGCEVYARYYPGRKASDKAVRGTKRGR